MRTPQWARRWNPKAARLTRLFTASVDPLVTRARCHVTTASCQRPRVQPGGAAAQLSIDKEGLPDTLIEQLHSPHYPFVASQIVASDKRRPLSVSEELEPAVLRLDALWIAA